MHTWAGHEWLEGADWSTQPAKKKIMEKEPARNKDRTATKVNLFKTTHESTKRRKLQMLRKTKTLWDESLLGFKELSSLKTWHCVPKKIVECWTTFNINIQQNKKQKSNKNTNAALCFHLSWLASYPLWVNGTAKFSGVRTWWWGCAALILLWSLFAKKPRSVAVL